MESCKRERGGKGLKWGYSDKKKEEHRMDVKCTGGCGGGSEGEEGNIFRSPLNASGISSRKRVKLQGKELEVGGPVDPALVPRRLRSAMNKRISQSASPPLSDSKKRQAHAPNGTPNSSSAERLKQNMLDEVTKDEKEVAEALTSMANLINIVKPVKEHGTLLEENSEIKTPSSSPSEAPRVEGVKLLVACNPGEPTDPSHCVQDSPGAMKADPSKLEQPTATSLCQKFNAAAKGPSQPNSLVILSSNIKSLESVKNLGDTTDTCNPLGASLQCFPLHGMLQPTQLDALVVQKQELGLWPPAPNLMEHDMQSFRQKSECVSQDMNRKGTDTDVQTGLHNRGHEQLKMPASSERMACSSPVIVSGRSGSRNCLPPEELPLMSTDKRRPWNKCATHIHISRLIQNYQKAEKKHPSILQSNPSKAKEGTSCNVHLSGETSGSRNGMIPSLSSASLIEKSMLEGRNRMLQDGRLLHAQKTPALSGAAQQAAALSGAYALYQQTYDLLSPSGAGDTKSSGNVMKSSGQLHVSYPPNQAVMPFIFARDSFTSQYEGQLVSGAAQQVQLQLPPYVAGSQLYGPHVSQAVGDAATKQQQLLWKAHLAQYRPPVGFLPKWQQNGRHDDSSTSPLMSQHPSIFPLPADYNLHNLQQPFILTLPPSSSPLPSRSLQKQHRSGSGLNPQSSSQLQMISNAESFR